MGGWHDDCSIELIAALESPLAVGQDIKNPNQADIAYPIVPVQLIIELFNDGEWVQHQQYYAPQYPMRGTDRAGLEISDMNFTLFDTTDTSILPFINGAVKGQRVRVKNANGTEVYFKGVVENVKNKAVSQRENGTDKRYITFNCIDEFYLFKRRPIREIIENTTECGMLADLTSRFAPELDISGINVDLGQPILKKTIQGEYLDELYREVLQNNPDLAFMLDITHDVSCVCMDAKDAAALQVPIELTDTNIYGYCVPGGFDISSTGKTYRNRVEHTAPRLYTEGTVDIEKDTRIVYGTATNWYKKVFPGDIFRIPGTESRYTIEKTLAQANGATQEIYLTGDIQEEDATGISYQVIGKDVTIEVQDDNEIERYKTLTGETGEDAGVRAVQISESTPLTEDEHEQVAENALRYSAYDGYLNTDNIKFPVKNLRAGQTIYMNMPLRFGQDSVAIQEIQWAIKKGEKAQVSGLDSPPIDYKISFKDRVLLSENAFRDLLLANRGSLINDFDKLTIRKSLGERYLMTVCTRHTEGEQVEEGYTLLATADEESTDSYREGPFYPAEVSEGQALFTVFDPDNALSTFCYPT